MSINEISKNAHKTLKIDSSKNQLELIFNYLKLNLNESNSNRNILKMLTSQAENYSKLDSLAPLHTQMDMCVYVCVFVRMRGLNGNENLVKTIYIGAKRCTEKTI